MTSRHLIRDTEPDVRADLSESPDEFQVPRDERTLFHQYHPPLWVERNDETGHNVGTWHCPGDYFPGRYSLPPFEKHEDEEEKRVHRYRFVQTFIDDWTGGDLLAPNAVLTFKHMDKRRGRSGLKLKEKAQWTRQAIKDYWAQERNPFSDNQPEVGRSLIPLVVGPVASAFRPRCVVNLLRHPDTDGVEMARQAALDPFFLSARWASTNWGLMPWQTCRFNGWILLEAGDCKFYFCFGLSKPERDLLDGAGPELNPHEHHITVWDVSLKGPTIVWVPPGCRWKVNFFQDSLLSVGKLVMKHGRNPLPAIPMFYNAQGLTDSSMVDNFPQATHACIVQSRP